jgi:hypothetical protein
MGSRYAKERKREREEGTDPGSEKRKKQHPINKKI